MRLRWRPAATVAGALLGLAASLAGSPGPAAASEAFGSYVLRSSASGYSILLGGRVDATVPDAATSFETDGIGYGRGSIAWPGAILGNAGDLAIIVAGGQIPKDAEPGVRTLNDPVRAEARAPSGPEESTYDQVPGIVMKAAANAAGATAQGSVQRSEFPEALAVGSAAAKALSRLEAEDVVAEATSTVNDISIGDVLHIDSIISTATATSDGIKASGTASTKVQGVTVAGQPATIDEHGLQIGSSSAPVHEAANQIARQALQAAGIEVIVSTPVITAEGPSATAGAGTVLISAGDGQVGMVFGGATASAAAAPAFDVATDPAANVVDTGSTLTEMTPGTIDLDSSTPSFEPTPAPGTVPPGPPQAMSGELAMSLGTANPLWLGVLGGFAGWLVAAALRRLGLGILELGPACDEGDQP